MITVWTELLQPVISRFVLSGPIESEDTQCCCQFSSPASVLLQLLLKAGNPNSRHIQPQRPLRGGKQGIFKKLVPGYTKNGDSKATFPAFHTLPASQDWIASAEEYCMGLHGAVSRDLT